ncbi:Gfo/Idh/MocA family protein [Boseongicola aestuarii]|uniref:Putative oxidoreductase YcjS n=1 Tax=Boseongicola aestuarii TaxID=1470561 RepID=A0A238J040_9RHOB|nr:Gfo/Idh/MocA family oxidoreductase [Boseongicola aestuarii]SMX23681.1 putative oxidoreductase YcjS [Boseongicola aestuarii]
MRHSVCIVGAGIGAEHLAGYAALPERYSVHSICDLDEARGRALADRQPGTGFTTSLDDVLRDQTIDIVDVCLPPHLHFDTCLRALDAGKKVICEKPLVSSLKEADALAERLEATGGFLAPVFQYRFGLGMAQLLALMDAGLPGRAFAGTLETHWDRQADYYAVPWRGTWAGEQGGAILGHAIHIHDLLSAALGPVAKVHAELATRVNDIEVEDCAALSLRMESGAVITSSVTLGCAENISRVRLMFEGFSVESDHAPYSPAEKGWHFTARAPTTQAQIDAVLASVATPPSGYTGLFAAIADALDGKDNRRVTFADARRSLEFVTAVYASARIGGPECLPIERDHPLYAGWTP